MDVGGLNDILKYLLDSNNKIISHQELIGLLAKVESDATKIYHDNYGLEEKIKFNIINDNDDNDNNSNFDPLGRQDVRSIQCIRQSIRKNLGSMNENVRTIFKSYLIRCGELDANNNIS